MKTIIIATTDNVVSSNCCEFLAAEGFNVFVVECCKVIDAIHQNISTVSIALIEERCGGLTTKVKNSFPTLSVLAVVASLSEAPDRLADDYLLMPFVLDDLKQKIIQLL